MACSSPKGNLINVDEQESRNPVHLVPVLITMLNVAGHIDTTKRAQSISTQQPAWLGVWNVPEFTCGTPD